MKSSKERAGFLRFSFSFVLINVHILNLPLAMVNIVYGDYPRVFTTSDLWIAYLILLIYVLVYCFILDRLGLHFYPIICLRSAWSVIPCALIVYMYYSILHGGNSLIRYLHPSL